MCGRSIILLRKKKKEFLVFLTLCDLVVNQSGEQAEEGLFDRGWVYVYVADVVRASSARTVGRRAANY